MRMEYERLLRRVFEVSRFGDPMGLADADVFTHGGNPQDLNTIDHEHDQRWLTGVSNALKKAKRDHDENTELYIALDDLDDRLWKAKKTADAVSIIEEAHKLLDEHGLYDNKDNW